MLRQIFKFYPRRNFSNSAVWKDSKKEVTSPPKQETLTNTTATTTPPPLQEPDFRRGPTMDFAPSEFEKIILVYSGKYKSKDEIPKRISYSALDTAKSKVRIKIANYLMLAIVLLMGFTVWKGKRHVKTKESKVAGELAQERKNQEGAALKSDY